MTIPLDLPPGRGGFGPALALGYGSATGNGPLGLGWDLGLGEISLRTEHGVPLFADGDEVVAGGSLLVRSRDGAGAVVWATRRLHGRLFTVTAFRPRVDGAFDRIERWADDGDPTQVSWRIIDGQNVTTWFGSDADSRIADPDDPRRIATWLPSLTFDDRGNAIRFCYRAEDSVGIGIGAAEAGRTDLQRSAARYLARVSWANQTPYRPDNTENGPPAAEPDTWMFHLVCDYGDHSGAVASFLPDQDWPVRPDVQSSRRNGFEVRTYRRCARLLIFHQFPDLGPAPVLVSSTALAYQGPSPEVGSLLTSITRTGFSGDGTTAELPALELEYVPWQLGDGVQTVTAADADMPAGIDGITREWVDLDGDGAPGILSRADLGWFYQRNLGPLSLSGNDSRRPRFAGPVLVADQPGGWPRDGSGAVPTFADVNGDGQLDLMTLDGPAPGAALRSGARWEPFRPFDQAPPAVESRHSLLLHTLVDLTGDGLADLLVDDGLRPQWHQGQGTAGFSGPAPVRRTARPIAPEPDSLLFGGDPDRTVLLADMSGDGLTDVVEVTRTGISYLPNLGHGRFGARVVMDSPPVLDSAEGFDPSRVLLGDVDGSGPADLVYLGPRGANLYRNLCGNAWSSVFALPGTPPGSELTQFAVVDLLGQGTGTLVFSTGAPHPDGAILRFVDLAAAGKPNLLRSFDNGLGASVECEFTASTFFQATDALAGDPWPTRLPFPVHCLTRVRRTDALRGTDFVTDRSYHLGHYDGVERQFMGFGRVDVTDSEGYSDVPGDLPPVLTRNWFHTGAQVPDGSAVLHPYRYQYADVLGPVLAEPDLPAGLDTEDVRHGVRALAGVALRTETYAADRSPLAAQPYSVTENTVELRRLQSGAVPPGPGQSAEAPVFQVLPAGEMQYATERDPDDPRVTQGLVLATDDLGCVTQAATLVFPRRIPDAAAPAEARTAQQESFVTCVDVDYTADLDDDDLHRLRVPFRTGAHQLTGLSVPPGAAVTSADLRAALAGAVDVDPDNAPSPGVGYHRRLLSRTETRFLAADLVSELPAGKQGANGLTRRGYRLAFTAGMPAVRFGTAVDDADLIAAGYVHLDGDDDWWAPSGSAVYPADAVDHFLLPSGFDDALGGRTTVERRFDLFIMAATNPLGHRIEAEHDLRTLAISLLTDVNGNRTAARFDPLGSVVATAMMGKSGAGEGDTLDAPTVSLTYQLDRWRTLGLPASVRILSREQFGPANGRFQEQHVYFDGTGAVLQAKAQDSPGRAGHFDPATGSVTSVDTGANPRWVGTGRTTVNNKGLALRSYEPFFSDSPEFDSAAELAEAGVSDVAHYDPLGRLTRVDHPDGTFATVERTAWRSRSFDETDSVLASAWFVERGSPDPAGAEPADPATRAAWLAARSAGTPAVEHFDPLGRPVAQLADNGGGDVRATRVEADLTVLHSRVFDASGRTVLETSADLLGRVCAASGPERGTTVTFCDVLGQPLQTIDALGRRFFVERDALQRTIRASVTDNAGTTVLLSRVYFGDERPGAAARNSVGRAVVVYDESGRVEIDGYDFAGSPTGSTRRFVVQQAGLPDWTAVAAAADPDAAADQVLESDHWRTAVAQDALGRPTRIELADGTVLTPAFDVGNHLQVLDAQPGGAGATVRLLAAQDHDASGRPLSSALGNGVSVVHQFDPLSRRLTGLRTTSPTGTALQGLALTYDPVGNVTGVQDSAQQTVFFANAVVTADRAFDYDALYQLVSATGRELAALAMADGGDCPVQPLPHPNDAQAVRRYAQHFSYDVLGNITQIRHTAGAAGWHRSFRYAYQDDPSDATNRLAATSGPGDADGVFSQAYGYDQLGNMTTLPQVRALQWDALGRLAGADLGGGGQASYAYGSGGSRVRKVVQNGPVTTETLYLGGAEIVREWHSGVLTFERRTVHLPGETGRIAQIDRVTVDNGQAGASAPVTRWVHTDHIGSACLLTDEQGRAVGYEEYQPFGSTCYRSNGPGESVGFRRYRFLGRERDDETGFSHLGARCYLPWLARWCSPDPAGYVDGLNLYRYARNNPATFDDPGGLAPRAARIVPPEVTTGRQFAAWAKRAGVVYTGTPTHDKGGWHVTSWDYAPPGQGGPKATGAGPAKGPDADGDAGTKTGNDAKKGDSPTPGKGDGDGSSGTSTKEASGEAGGGTGKGTGPNDGSGKDAADGGAAAKNPDPAGKSDAGKGSDTSGLSPSVTAAKVNAQEVARPASVTGDRPSGTLHLWSGTGGKADAKAAIAKDKSGWMMGDISPEPGVTPGNPTPQHAKAEVEFAHAKAAAPGGRLTPGEMDRIWGDPSAEVVGRGAFAGHPVEAHGTPSPTSIQVTREIPARSLGGALGGALSIAGGMFQAIVGGQDPNPGVAVGSVLTGVGETTSGIIFGAGAILGATEAMAIGAAGATFFGGAGAAIGFGTAAVRAYRSGDTAGAVVNALGAIGGLLLIASLFTPVGWVALLGVGLVGLAAGFNIGRWWGSR